MHTVRRYRSRACPRDLLYFTRPDLWPLRPFLPVRRTRGDGSSELGVLYDAVGVSDTYGYSATVFVSNLFDLPLKEADFLALPRHVYDTAVELAEDGWVVD